MGLLKKIILPLVVVAAIVYGVSLATRQVAIVAPVSRGKAIQGAPSSVTVLAENTSPIVSEVGGRIKTEGFNLDPGARVKAGDVLAYLDTTTLLLEIDRTQSELDAARRRKEIGIPLERDLENARDVLADFENKFRSGNLAESELQKQKRAVQQLEQRVNLEKATEDQLIGALENKLKMQRVQLDATTIKARINGQIAEVSVNAEQFIGDRHVVATMITDSRVVEAKVSEEHYSDLKIGQHASVRFLGLGSQEYGASVTKILPTADPVTQRYGVHLTVDLDPTRLAPGLTGEASIITGVRENTLIIPRRALFGDSVYLIEDGKVQLRRVQTGYSSLNAVEVVSGLEEGNLVIVDQLQRYRVGDRVRTQVETSTSP